MKECLQFTLREEGDVRLRQPACKLAGRRVPRQDGAPGTPRVNRGVPPYDPLHQLPGEVSHRPGGQERGGGKLLNGQGAPQRLARPECLEITSLGTTSREITGSEIARIDFTALEFTALEFTARPAGRPAPSLMVIEHIFG